jgi:hypothetical protein
MVIHAPPSSDFSAKYYQSSLTSCRNGCSFTFNAFSLKRFFPPFFPFRPLVQSLLPLTSLNKENDDDNNDGGTQYFLVFGRGRGGGIEDIWEGGIAGTLEGGMWDAHLSNLLAASPDDSPSSCSFYIVVGFFIFCLNISQNLSCIAFSTFSHYSFLYSIKSFFSFWICLSLYSC